MTGLPNNSAARTMGNKYFARFTVASLRGGYSIFRLLANHIPTHCLYPHSFSLLSIDLRSATADRRFVRKICISDYRFSKIDFGSCTSLLQIADWRSPISDVRHMVRCGGIVRKEDRTHALDHVPWPSGMAVPVESL